MKNNSNSPSTKVLIFLVQIVCLVVFLPTSHCNRMTVFFPMDANLIAQTCNQTPYPDLCVSTLQSDPRSAKADVKGLGIIMVDAVRAKAHEANLRLEDLINRDVGNVPAQDCRFNYDDIFQLDIPQAVEAFGKDDYKSAELGMTNVVANEDSCEKRFSGGSPFKDESQALHDVAYVAAAIAKVLRS
ncbi:cell wall / vacuolar inhibitor of fructosidase 1-like [Pyrus ussuriensis x Pyrus communis]|uniref:Cell wall / vacuolar inhibitor of fructosidase 1-like n=1 Tax=Pyrus ussuriensis x Pyrus communis TaxID=2448454 RepID=A0A5N5H9G0_9ROSA|nr:cell wall / vacuolar inhibitor of fructosidase 1-like [Pyrus ussuriensis x Pyrus communis]